jgi:hypothetical protein
MADSMQIFLCQISLHRNLITPKATYNLIELEGYCFNNVFKDIFCHKDPRQMINEQFYIHRKGGTLKNGTFKGIDITFGNENSYFGVLIRSLRNMTTGEITEGPCLVVNQLMSDCNTNTVQKFAELVEGPNIFDSSSPIRLALKLDEDEFDKFIFSPRVGLFPTKNSAYSHEYLCWVFRPWRLTIRTLTYTKQAGTITLKGKNKIVEAYRTFLASSLGSTV